MSEMCKCGHEMFDHGWYVWPNHGHVRRCTLSGCRCFELFPDTERMLIPEGSVIPTAADKADTGKRRFSLLPPGVLRQVVDVFEYGAKKYSPHGWKKVPDAHARYLDAAARHLDAILSGEETDPESGLPHAAHAIASLMILLATARNPTP